MGVQSDGIARAASGIDKIKNAIGVLTNPDSSELQRLQAKENIAQGVVSVGQAIDQLSGMAPSSACA